MAVGGGSADRKAEELASSGDEAAVAWAAGAEGERRVAAELSNLREAWTVLHDRLLRPGQSDANLDHVVVGPGGLFLVDAKNRAGRVMEWEGGLFQHVTRDGGRQSLSLAAELKKVHGMATYMAVESDRPVTPVLCLAGAQEAEFGEPQMVQGVWVVPVSRLVEWLNARPHVLDREAVQRAVTRAMTDFPSTTTDPQLLSAIGQAAVREKRARQAVRRSSAPRRPTQSPRSRGRARPSIAERLARALLGLAMMLGGVLLFFTVGIPLLASTLETLGSGAGPDSGPAAEPSVSAQPSATPKASKGKATPAKGVTAKATPKPKPVVPALAPTDCARATAAEVAKVVGRKVQPFLVSGGCGWGTRLDDPSTVLVSIRLSEGHRSWDTQLEASVKQRRVVYGTAYDSTIKPSTVLWVATGQPISADKRTRALADTRIEISTARLGLTDDQARGKALAIARALNN